VDRIEQRHGFLGLVRLELADQMELDPGSRLAQLRPFGLGLLHAILAEDALAGGDQRLGSPRRSWVLEIGDQGDVAGLAAGEAGGMGDPLLDLGQPRISIV
jgi:hypothetical protein